MPKTFRIETFGCQMNVHDSERMAGLLERAGYLPAVGDEDADVIVVNTCSVREHAEEKLYTRLGELRVLERETGRRRVVVVAGCVAQQEGHALLGNKNGPVVTFPFGVARRGDPVRAYVTIIEGCNDHCAFCVVPYTRGHERMRAKRDILADAHEAAASGRKEIQLLGQIVNHYQAPDDPACDFAQLLEEVHEIPGVERIRFASPHPRHTGDRLIQAVRDLPKVCKHLHLPVQSGSTRILRAMRRRYTREDYLDLVSRVRAEIPGVSLSTDVIVGFPGETAQDFEDTLSLASQAQYHSMFSFKYSPRPNTLSAKRLADDVSESEKTERIVALQALQRDIQTRLHEGAVGSTVEVLVDSWGQRHGTPEVSGRTSGNTVVHCPLPADTPLCDLEGWVGRTVPVFVRGAGPHSLRGEVRLGDATEGGAQRC